MRSYLMPSTRARRLVRLMDSLAQGANLEDIGVIPTFTQRRVGKYKLELGVKTKQLFFFLHNQVISASGVVAAGLVIIGGLCLSPFLIDGEIAVMHLFRLCAQIHFIKEALIVWMGCKAAIFFFEHQRILAFFAHSVCAIAAV